MNEMRPASDLHIPTITLESFMEAARGVSKRHESRSPALWRTHLIGLIAQASGREFREVRQIMSAFEPSKISGIRRIYYNGEDPFVLIAGKRKASIVRNKERRAMSNQELDAPPEVEESDLTASALRERFASEYVTAIGSLPNHMRTRKHLAHRLNFSLTTVDSYLFQNPTIANMLTDGQEVFKVNFLQIKREAHGN